VLIASTNPGDIVLDPFFGSGSTGAVAKMLGRHFIGIDRDKSYIAAAGKRIATVDPSRAEDLKTTPSKRNAPRVPFGAVVEQGLLRPGKPLFAKNKKVKAYIRADGSLAFKDKDGATVQGSIHKIGAHAQQSEACNGWTYWHYEEKTGLKPIDFLREKMRAKMKS